MLTSLADVLGAGIGKAEPAVAPIATPEAPASAIPPPVRALNSVPVGLDDRLPQNVGMLYISDDQAEGKIQIMAFCSATAQYGPRSHGAPKRGIRVEDARLSEDVYYRMS